MIAVFLFMACHPSGRRCATLKMTPSHFYCLRETVIQRSSVFSSLIGMLFVMEMSSRHTIGWEEQAMDDYQEELLDARAVEQDLPERDEDATEL